MGAAVVTISTFDDEHLDVYARLTEHQLRNRLEPQKGMFIAESFKVMDIALAEGIEPVSFLVAPHWLDQTVVRAEAWHDAHPASAMPLVYVAEESVLRQLTGFSLSRGALCAMKRPVLPSVADVVAGARRIAVLDGIVDHTNVGAIFRSAAALNVDAVLVTPTCSDPLYRRSVRVSMGTVFQVPWARLEPPVHARTSCNLALLHELGFTTAAFALTDQSVRLDDPSLTKVDRLAMIFGTEGDGLSSHTIEGCDLTVRIPMAHGVDSLNVAAASAVAFWHMCSH